MISSFHFLRPEWLWALPVAGLVWWHWRRSSDPMRAWRQHLSAELLAALTMHPGAHPRWRGLALLIAWLLVIIALAGPAWRPAPSPFADDPTPAMVLLKADASMNLTDLAPDRMKRAELKIAALAKERAGQPLGLIAYAGSPHLVLPPTRDTAVVAAMAAEITPAIMPKPGDDLAGALQLADRSLEKTGGAIVVVADTIETAALAQLQPPRWPVKILAIARPESPEWLALQAAARQLGGKATLIRPDNEDVVALTRDLAAEPRMVDGPDGQGRWAEDGWWLLIPITTLFLWSILHKHRGEEVTA